MKIVCVCVYEKSECAISSIRPSITLNHFAYDFCCDSAAINSNYAYSAKPEIFLPT